MKPRISKSGGMWTLRYDSVSWDRVRNLRVISWAGTRHMLQVLYGKRDVRL